MGVKTTHTHKGNISFISANAHIFHMGSTRGAAYRTVGISCLCASRMPVSQEALLTSIHSTIMQLTFLMEFHMPEREKWPRHQGVQSQKMQTRLDRQDYFLNVFFFFTIQKCAWARALKWALSLVFPVRCVVEQRWPCSVSLSFSPALSSSLILSLPPPERSKLNRHGVGKSLWDTGHMKAFHFGTVNMNTHTPHSLPSLCWAFRREKRASKRSVSYNAPVSHAISSIHHVCVLWKALDSCRECWPWVSQAALCCSTCQQHATAILALIWPSNISYRASAMGFLALRPPFSPQKNPDLCRAATLY